MYTYSANLSFQGEYFLIPQLLPARGPYSILSASPLHSVHMGLDVVSSDCSMSDINDLEFKCWHPSRLPHFAQTEAR